MLGCCLGGTLSKTSGGVLRPSPHAPTCLHLSGQQQPRVSSSEMSQEGPAELLSQQGTAPAASWLC